MHGLYATNIAGFMQAERMAQQWLSPRYRKLDRLERYVVGEQYEGLPDFFNPKQDVPLMERAPNVVHSIVEAAIRQHCDFAFGEGRFPGVSAAADDDERLLGEGMPDEMAQLYEAWLRLLMRNACFPEACGDALANAEACGTAVSVVALVSGCPTIQTLRAKWCTPEFDESGSTIVALEVQYPYFCYEKSDQGQWMVYAKLYRRRIDAQRDVVYKPLDMASMGATPRDDQWQEDPAKSVTHALGFCPVIWYKLRSSYEHASEIDGYPIHGTQLDELDALNYSLSQRGRAAIYSGDPQAYETGVDPQAPPAGGMGRAAIVPAKDGSGYVFGSITGGRPARKKGAGTVWSYENPEAKVGLLSLPGDALNSISDHVADICDKIGEVLGYTKASPETVKGAMSGKALAFLYHRTTSFVDGLRQDFWHGWMVPTLNMLNRVVYTQERRAPGSVYIHGVQRAMPILATFSVDVQGVTMWMPPRLRARWGKYFGLTAQDESEVVRMTVDAYNARVIPLRLALEKLQNIYPHDDSEKLSEEMEHELAEQAMHEAAVVAKQNANALEDAEQEGPPSSVPGAPPSEPAPDSEEAGPGSEPGFAANDEPPSTQRPESLRSKRRRAR